MNALDHDSVHILDTASPTQAAVNSRFECETVGPAVIAPLPFFYSARQLSRQEQIGRVSGASRP